MILGKSRHTRTCITTSSYIFISQIFPFLAILLHAKVKMIHQIPIGIQLAESNNVICFFLNSESYINSFEGIFHYSQRRIYEPVKYLRK